MSLDSFITTVTKDVLRPAQYQVQFGRPYFDNSPYALDMFNSYLTPNNSVPLLAESVTLPGRQVLTKQMTYFGSPREIPYDSAYGEDISITFIMTKGDSVRLALEAWMDAIVDPYLGYINYYIDFIGRMRIAILDQQGEAQKTVCVDEVFPKAIMPMTLGAELSDQYTKFMVNFGFRLYTFYDCNAGECYDNCPS